VDVTQGPPAASSSTFPMRLALHDLQLHCKRRSLRECSKKLLMGAGCTSLGTSANNAGELMMWVSTGGPVRQVIPRGSLTVLHFLLQLERHVNVFDWLERPNEFRASLHRACEKMATDADTETMAVLGYFVFREPAREDPSFRWIGQFRLMDVSDDADQDILIEISNIRELNSSAPQARPNPHAERQLHVLKQGQPQLNCTL